MPTVEQVPIVGPFVPNLVGAIVILIVGWLVALLVSRAVAGALRRTGLDRRIAGLMGGGETPVQVATWTQTIVFWLLFLFVLLAFFQSLGLTLITTPLAALLGEVFAYLPRLAGALVLIVLAWVLATILRLLVTRTLQALRLDQRLSDQAAPDGAAADATTRPATAARAPLSRTLGEVVYWLVWLLFLPAILDALSLGSLLAPVVGMLDKAIGYLPNILAAAVILLVGWFVAGIVRRIVSNLLAAAGLDQLIARLGVGQTGIQRASDLVGLVVYVLILLPVVTAALNALGLDAVTRPLSDVLNTVLAAIPRIFAAALVLLIAYVMGRLVASLVAGVLAELGFDRLPARLGLAAIAPGPTSVTDTTTLAGRTPSQTAGQLVLAAIMLFAAIEAARQLGFQVVADLLAQLLVLAGQILLGLIIIAIGLYLADLIARAVRTSNVQNAGLLATAARVAIIGLAVAMGLRQMGVANEIVNLAFALLLGAIAVAAALAFGLGGRNAAGRELEAWLDGRTTPPGTLRGAQLPTATTPPSSAGRPPTA
jgi:hypothetical protein